MPSPPQLRTIGTERKVNKALSGLGISAHDIDTVVKHFAPDEIPQLRRAFDQIDADGNGEISPTELQLLFHR